jgi:hypothetical protein
MSELSKKYREIMDEIDSRFTNEEDLKFVKSKISDISIIFIDIIDRMSEIVDEKVSNIEKSQTALENKLDKVQGVIDEIEKDMYDENSTDFEIVCPYCNNEFFSEINYDEENEIECPSCHNIIEIDINADIDDENYGCSGGCNRCKGCNRNNDEEDI